MNERSIPILIAAIASLAGCLQGAAANPCDLAADRVAECTGERPEVPLTCTGEELDGAERVIASDCGALSLGKADGFFCQAWTRWLGLCDEGDPASFDAEENRRWVVAAEHWIAEGTYFDGVTPEGAECYVTVEHADDVFGYEYSVYIYGLGSGFGKAHFFGLTDRESDTLVRGLSEDGTLDLEVRHRSAGEWDFGAPAPYREATTLFMDRVHADRVDVTVGDDVSEPFTCSVALDSAAGAQRCVYAPAGDRFVALSADDDVYPRCGRDEYCRTETRTCGGEGICTPRPVHCPYPHPGDPADTCGCGGGEFQSACQAHQSGTDFFDCGAGS